MTRRIIVRVSPTGDITVEADSGGLLEFVQSRYDLSLVAGNDAAKQKLRDAASALKAGIASGGAPWSADARGPAAGRWWHRPPRALP